MSSRRQDGLSDETKPSLTPAQLLPKAIALLSRREHSEAELRHKLRRYTEDEGAIDSVITRLQREGWQSDERFIETYVAGRQHRWGNLKILQGLSQHQLDEEQVATLKDALKDSEYERACEVFDRKFGRERLGSLFEASAEHILADADDHGSDQAVLGHEERAKRKAKQMRFLASRGFSAEVVYRVLRERGELD